MSLIFSFYYIGGDGDEKEDLKRTTLVHRAQDRSPGNVTDGGDVFFGRV